MDASILQKNALHGYMRREVTDEHRAFSPCQEELSAQNLLEDFIKHSLLLVADKLLMARKSPGYLDCSTREMHHEDEGNNPEHTSKWNNEVIRSSCRHFNRESEGENEDFDISKSLYSPSGGYETGLPSQILAFLVVAVVKLVGFLMGIFVRFFSVPIWALNIWLLFLMFPLRTVVQIRDQVRQKLLKACKILYLTLVSFMFSRLKLNSKESILKLAIRLCKAFLCSIYVFLLLLGLLVSGFAISSVAMKALAEEPVHRTESLNFDYTKTSPSAVVPVTSSPVGRRAIPFNHKTKFTVALTLPESEYNRKLGVFQVRVETLSAKGEALIGSSYPTMLRFKSQPIRLAETLFKSVPLITGLQSEVQNLKIETEQFVEGYEPTAFLKVSLEQRAEFQDGSGAPQIYAASLRITSELPLAKRLLWNWRRTVFIWIGFASFLGEIMFLLLFSRPVILPGRRSKASKTN